MKRFLMLLILVLSVGIIAGCGGGDKEEKQQGDNKAAEKTADMTIGLAVSTLNNPFFVDLRDGAKEYADEIGAKLVVVDAQDDASQQVSQVENLITQNVDVILLNPTDSDGLVAAVTQANQADIPVVTLDRAVNGGEVSAHVASDNVAGGKLAGEFIAKKLNDQGKVVELEGIAGTSAARDRGKGFHDVIDTKDNIEVVAKQPADFNRDRGLNVMENILQAQKEINAVFAHNDEMALGALRALEDANIKDVVVVGFDGTDDAVKSVNDGKMSATVAQQPKIIGETGVKTAERIIKGEKVDKTIPVELKVISKEQ